VDARQDVDGEAIVHVIKYNADLIERGAVATTEYRADATLEAERREAVADNGLPGDDLPATGFPVKYSGDEIKAK
jgi:hypothetical protein